MATIFMAKRDDDGDLSAYILTEKSNKPTEMGFFANIAELKEAVKLQYGEDAVLVPQRKFQAELESRQVHTPEMIDLLDRAGDLEDGDLRKCVVYGSPLRPASASWMRIPGAVFIQVEKASTGYHTYIAVPDGLDKVMVDRYELVFMSGPAK